MLCDAHCHPFDLLDYTSGDLLIPPEGVICASSSCDLEQFEYCEKAGGALGFAIHPQLPAGLSDADGHEQNLIYDELFPLIEKLAKENRLDDRGTLSPMLDEVHAR